MLRDKEMQKHKTMSAAVNSWMVLIVLSVMAIYLPTFIDNRSMYTICALIIVMIKGQQIVDVFMELSNAPKFWRVLFLSYIVLLPLIISVIYLM